MIESEDEFDADGISSRTGGNKRDKMRIAALTAKVDAKDR